MLNVHRVAMFYRKRKLKPAKNEKVKKKRKISPHSCEASKERHGPIQDIFRRGGSTRPSSGSKKLPSRRARRTKAKRRWLREVESMEVVQETLLDKVDKDNGQEGKEKNNGHKLEEHNNRHQQTETMGYDEEVEPVIVGPGDNHFMPLDEENNQSFLVLWGQSECFQQLSSKDNFVRYKYKHECFISVEIPKSHLHEAWDALSSFHPNIMRPFHAFSNILLFEDGGVSLFDFLSSNFNMFWEYNRDNEVIGISELFRDIIIDMMEGALEMDGRGCPHGYISLGQYLLFKYGRKYVLKVCYILDDDVKMQKTDDFLGIASVIEEMVDLLEKGCKANWRVHFDVMHFIDRLKKSKHRELYRSHPLFWSSSERVNWYCWARGNLKDKIARRHIISILKRHMNGKKYRGLLAKFRRGWQLNDYRKLIPKSRRNACDYQSVKSYIHFVRNSVSHAENMYKGADPKTGEERLRALFPEAITSIVYAMLSSLHEPQLPLFAANSQYF